MKSLISVLLICVFGGFACGQNHDQEKDFINQVITEHEIIYVDRASNGEMLRDDFKNIKQRVFYSYNADSIIYVDKSGLKTCMSRVKAESLAFKNNGEIIGRLVPIIADSIKLSATEIENFIQKFTKGSERKWDANFIEGAKQIAKDTITAVFKEKNNKGWPYMYKKGIRSFHRFSVPVFIKGGDYCIFYSDESCGNLCGSGELAIYKKEHGKWKLWGIISSWIS